MYLNVHFCNAVKDKKLCRGATSELYHSQKEYLNRQPLRVPVFFSTNFSLTNIPSCILYKNLDSKKYLLKHHMYSIIKRILSIRIHGTYSEGYHLYMRDMIEGTGRTVYAFLTPRLRYFLISYL